MDDGPRWGERGGGLGASLVRDRGGVLLQTGTPPGSSNAVAASSPKTWSVTTASNGYAMTHMKGISVAVDHMLAIRNEGLFGVGSNFDGGLGSAPTSTLSAWSSVSGVPGVTDVSTSYYNALATDGTNVYCTGSGYWACGDGLLHDSWTS